MSGGDVLVYSVIGFFVLIFIETIRRRQVWIPLIHLTIGLMIIALGVAFVTSSSGGTLAFGDTSLKMWALAAILLGAGMGVVAQYVFHLERGTTIQWFEVLKALCISPVLVLPVITSVQGHDTIKPFQLVVFWLLAFQNGFFWRAVFEKVQVRVGT